MPLTLLADSTCDICAEQYDTDGALAPSFIPCGHVVCRRCLGSCQPRRCPYCRMPYDWSDVRALVCDIALPATSGSLSLSGLKGDDARDEPSPALELEPELEPVVDPEPTRKERENAKAQSLLNKLHDAFHKEREAGDNGRLDRIGEKRIFKSRRFLEECEDSRDYLVLEQATLMLQGFLEQREQHKQDIEAQKAHRMELMSAMNESWQGNINNHYKPRIEELERKLEEAERKLRERQPPSVAPLYYPQYSLASRSTTPYAVPPAPSPSLRSFHQIPATNDHNPMPAAPSIHGGLRRGMRVTSTPDVRPAPSPYAGHSDPAPVAGPSRTASYSYPQRDRAQVDSIPLLQPPPSARHFSPQPADTPIIPSRHFSPPGERDEASIPTPSTSRHYPYPEAVPGPSSIRHFSPVRSEAGPPPRAPTLGRRALPSEEELAQRTGGPAPQLQLQSMREYMAPSAVPDDDDSAGFVYSLWRPGRGNATADVFVAPGGTPEADLPPPAGAHRVSAFEFDFEDASARMERRMTRGVVVEVGKGLRDAQPGEVLQNRYVVASTAGQSEERVTSPRAPVALEHYRTRSREAVRGYQPSHHDATRRAPGLWSPMDSDSDAARGL